MKQFMDRDFLLQNDCAKHLFHDYAEREPICDYHCHLSPKEIYENKSPDNITSLWLGADHYKWRAMRSCGISEDYCTGGRPPREKFEKFAYTLQYAIGNPLYHWAHIELQKYFGINTPLSLKTADEIYDKANEKIKNGDFRPQTLIQKSNVKYICTTDDPADDLKYHKLLKNAEFSCTVLPTFRPDNALNIEKPGFSSYIKKLSDLANVSITDFSSLVKALSKRAAYFESLGCRVSDQSFEYIPFKRADGAELDKIIKKALSAQVISREESDAFKTELMLQLGLIYSELNFVMELHIGPIRNNNTKMFNLLGADTGFDSVGDASYAKNLSRFLDTLNSSGSLPKTILFNLNNKDNIVLGTMLGNFQSDEAQSKIQLGPAWWFLDSIDGMTSQLKTLGNLGILGKFVGMETDSRSFTSYGRHDYFRRILCNLVGTWVNEGMYAPDDEMLKQIIQGISYNNAVKYFEFN